MRRSALPMPFNSWHSQNTAQRLQWWIFPHDTQQASGPLLHRYSSSALLTFVITVHVRGLFWTELNKVLGKHSFLTSIIPCCRKDCLMVRALMQQQDQAEAGAFRMPWHENGTRWFSLAWKCCMFFDFGLRSYSLCAVCVGVWVEKGRGATASWIPASCSQLLQASGSRQKQSLGLARNTTTPGLETLLSFPKAGRPLPTASQNHRIINAGKGI